MSRSFDLFYLGECYLLERVFWMREIFLRYLKARLIRCIKID